MRNVLWRGHKEPLHEVSLAFVPMIRSMDEHLPEGYTSPSTTVFYRWIRNIILHMRRGTMLD